MLRVRQLRLNERICIADNSRLAMEQAAQVREHSLVPYASSLSCTCTSMYANAGPPLQPSPTFQIKTLTQLVLSWDKPFTWIEVADILYYTVRMYNSSSQELMNWTDTSEPSTIKYNRYFVEESMADQCMELTFEVSATNVIGSSKYGSIKGGFPVCK